MPQLVRMLLCLLVLGLGGCSVANLQQSEPEQLKLLPPDEGPGAVLLKQKVTVISQGQEQEQQFIAVIRLQPDRLKLVALLPTGQQLFFLEYDGEALIQNNFSSMDLPTKDMLAIMQFALWPALSVNHHYTVENGWIVKITPEQRTLLTSSGVLLKVNYQDGTIMIENRLHNYRLKVQPLQG